MVSLETIAEDPVGPTRAIRQAMDSFGHSDAQSKRDYLEDHGMGERCIKYSTMSGCIDALSKAKGRLETAQREGKLSKMRAGDVEEWAKSCELQGLLAKDLGGMLIGHPFGERADPRTHVPSSQGQYVCCAVDQGSHSAASGRLPYRPYHTAVWPILSRHKHIKAWGGIDMMAMGREPREKLHHVLAYRAKVVEVLGSIVSAASAALQEEAAKKSTSSTAAQLTLRLLVGSVPNFTREAGHIPLLDRDDHVARFGPGPGLVGINRWLRLCASAASAYWLWSADFPPEMFGGGTKESRNQLEQVLVSQSLSLKPLAKHLELYGMRCVRKLGCQINDACRLLEERADLSSGLANPELKEALLPAIQSIGELVDAATMGLHSLATVSLRSKNRLPIPSDGVVEIDEQLGQLLQAAIRFQRARQWVLADYFKYDQSQLNDETDGACEWVSTWYGTAGTWQQQQRGSVDGLFRGMRLLLSAQKHALYKVRVWRHRVLSGEKESTAA